MRRQRSSSPLKRKSGVRAVVVCALLWITSCERAPAVEAASRFEPRYPLALEHGEQRVDFGSIDAQHGLERDLSLLNHAAHAIRISRLSASCGCTSLALSPNPIPAGGRGTLRVTLDPAGKSGPIDSLLLGIDDAAQQVAFRIAVTATVRATAFVWAEPARVELGSVSSGALPRASTRVKCRVPHGTDLPELRLLDPLGELGTAFELRALGAADTSANGTCQDYELSADFPRELAAGRFVELAVVVAGAAGPRARIAFVGSVESELRASVARVFADGVKLGSTVKREIEISGPDREKVAKLRLETSADWIRARELRGAAGGLILELALTPRQAGLSSGQLQVERVDGGARLTVAISAFAVEQRNDE
jgi:hypothetical protein